MSNSRWSLSKFFRFYKPNQQFPREATLGSESLEGQYDWLDFRMVSLVLSLSKVGEYTISYNERRPDLISLDIYGSQEYWEILLVYNDVLSVDELIPGRVLKYPSREDLEYSLFRSPNPRSTSIPSYSYDSEGALVKE